MTEKVLEPIMNGSRSIMGGHTLSANPLSCAIALAVLEYMEDNDLVEHSAKRGKELFNGLKKLAKKYSFIGDLRGRGLLIGMEFVQDKETKEPFPKTLDVTAEIIKAGMNNGIILYPASAGLDGINGAAIIISPPLIITKEESAELLRRLDSTLREFKDKILPGYLPS